MSLSPDFSKKDINKNIDRLINEGYEVVQKVSDGDSWESVISILDEFGLDLRESVVLTHI